MWQVEKGFDGCKMWLFVIWDWCEIYFVYIFVLLCKVGVVSCDNVFILQCLCKFVFVVGDISMCDYLFYFVGYNCWVNVCIFDVVYVFVEVDCCCDCQGFFMSLYVMLDYVIVVECIWLVCWYGEF